MKNKKLLLIISLFTILLFISSLYILFLSLSGTFAWFTNNSTEVVPPHIACYFPNWPLKGSPSSHCDQFYTNYTFLDNMFGIPEGYEFAGWNTIEDGSGIYYRVDESFDLDDNIFIFAQWRKTVNGDITDEEGSSDLDKDDSLGSDTSNNDITVPGNGSGNSGNGSNDSSGANNNSQVESDVSSNNSGAEFKEEIETEVLPDAYYFVFMDGVSEFDKTSCDVNDGVVCKLVLPDTIPQREGYLFKGWSFTGICNKDNIVNDSVDVTSDSVYHACFEAVPELEKNKHSWIYLICGVWIITGFLLYKIIREFIRKNKNINID